MSKIITKLGFNSKKSFFFIVLFLLIQLISTSIIAQQIGKISGKITDKTSGSFLPSANVMIMNTSTGTASDQKGYYSISKIKPGTYKLRSTYLGYQEQIIEVTVVANRTVVVDFVLVETTTELESAIVYGEMTRGQAKSLNEQKNAANIKNVISSELFQRFPDRNAAETVARIPGVSITYDQGEGEMVQIRGIAPEYNSLTINGQRIPAPDPDAGRAVGLDLLNQDLMETIEVTKALTPDIDGDAIGGNINFVMKQAPEKGMLGINVGAGYNAQESDFNNYGSDIIDLSGFAGTRFFDNKLGVLVAGSYYKTNRGSTLREFEYDDLAAGHIEAQHSNDYDVKRERFGINLNTEYKFDDFNRIFLNLNHNQYLDNEIRRTVEFYVEDNEEEKTTRNRLEDQTLSTAMFGGFHNVNNIKIDYQASWFKAQEEIPKRTYFRYGRDNDLTIFTNDEIKEFGPTTVFTGQDPLTLNRIRVDHKLKSDADIAGLVNIEIPYQFMNNSSSAKFGGKITNKSVKFEEIRLELKKFPDDHTIGEAEFGFEDVTVGINETNFLGAESYKYKDMSDDNYDASESIIAAYGMTTINYNKFTLLAGARFENTTNEYQTLAIESVNQEASKASYSNILPSAHLTYKFAEDMNLRFAYSTGLSRPNYKSLVPVEFRDDDERKISRGNPDLEPTNSNNFDIMFEKYTSFLGLFSTGIYYKKMSNIIINTTVYEELPYEGGTQLYEIRMPINGDDIATVYGIEIAFNQRLNFWGGSFFKYFNIYANYTYTETEVEVKGRKVPLGSSPNHVGNLAIMYDNPKLGLSFVISNNYRSAILKSVGADIYTDAYYKGEYHLDFSVTQEIMENFTLFLQVNNLTNQEEHETFGDPTEDFYKMAQWAKFGRYGTLGISYKL